MLFRVEKKVIICFFLIFASIAVCSIPVRAQPQSSFFLEFIYIDATAGEAAAGHSAIKLGQTVFHYEFHPGGLLLLTRQSWDSFRYYYNDLSNRTLILNAIPLPESAFRNIQHTFLKQYIAQEIDLERHHNLKAEYQLLTNLSQGNKDIAIDGLGFFSSIPGSGNLTAKKLLATVENVLGRDFLSQTLRNLEQSAPVAEKTYSPLSPEINILKTIPDSEPQIIVLKDFLTLKEALLILLKKKGLQIETLVHSAHPDETNGEIFWQRLEELQQYTLKSILRLLGSDRADRGRALLIEIGRYHAIERSFTTGKLHTLYPFKTLWTFKKKASSKSRHDAINHLDLLLNDASLFLERSKKTFCSIPSGELTIAYSMLETYQGKLVFYELLEGDKIHYQKLFDKCGLPCLTGESNLPAIQSQDYYREQAVRVQEKLSVVEKSLSSQYGYNLFTKNCSTELIRSINNSFSGKEAIEETLGGYFLPGAGLNYVPFALHDTVKTSFNVTHQEVLPAYRLRTLERLYREEGEYNWLREGNTLGSTIYSPWEDDGYFLFFTDDLFLSRPIFGLANLCYGALQTLSGVVTAPIDDGLRFSRGLDGFLFSFPELFFFNIRKGSFQVLDR